MWFRVKKAPGKEVSGTFSIFLAVPDSTQDQLTVGTNTGLTTVLIRVKPHVNVKEHRIMITENFLVKQFWYEIQFWLNAISKEPNPWYSDLMFICWWFGGWFLGWPKNNLKTKLILDVSLRWSLTIFYLHLITMTLTTARSQFHLKIIFNLTESSSALYIIVLFPKRYT